MFKKAQQHLKKAAVYANLYRFGNDGDTKDCPICLFSLSSEVSELGNPIMCYFSDNKHGFHEKCLFDWILSKNENSCPLCKTKVLDVGQVNGLPDEILDVIIDVGKPPSVRLDAISSEQLDHMFHDNPLIQHKEFKKADWRNATIGGQEQAYSFLQCEFHCCMDHSKISNVNFYQCDLFSHKTTMRKAKFESVRFYWSRLFSVPFDGSTFNNCVVGGTAYDSSLKNCRFQGGSLDKFQLVYMDIAMDIQCMSGCRFDNVKLKSCRWNSVNASLSKFVDCTINECNFSHGVMSDVEFVNCTFSNCDWSDASIKSSFQDCKFTKCDFTRANLRNCTFVSTIKDSGSVVNSDFTESDLEFVTFEHYILENSTFSETRMSNSRLSECTIKSCTFSKYARLKDADFTGSTLRKCHFERAIMNGAIFRKCHIVLCDFHNSDFEGVDFTNAHLKLTKFTKHQKKYGNFLHAVIDGVKQTETKVMTRFKIDTGSTHTFLGKRQRGDDEQEPTQKNTHKNTREHMRWRD